MKRIDIYLAIGVFLVLLGCYEYNEAHGIANKLIEFFLTGTFGALLTLFQSRARVDAHTESGDVNVKAPDGGSGK